jgi:hypothetical protein
MQLALFPADILPPGNERRRGHPREADMLAGETPWRMFFHVPEAAGRSTSRFATRADQPVWWAAPQPRPVSPSKYS